MLHIHERLSDVPPLVYPVPVRYGFNPGSTLVVMNGASAIVARVYLTTTLGGAAAGVTTLFSHVVSLPVLPMFHVHNCMVHSHASMENEENDNELMKLCTLPSAAHSVQDNRQGCLGCDGYGKRNSCWTCGHHCPMRYCGALCSNHHWNHCWMGVPGRKVRLLLVCATVVCVVHCAALLLCC